VDGVDGYTCACPRGVTGQSCECASLDDDDDRTANCSAGVTTPHYYTSGDGDDEEPATPTSSTAPDAETTTWTTFRTSRSDDGRTSAAGFSIFSSTTPFDHVGSSAVTAEPTEPDRNNVTAADDSSTTDYGRTTSRWSVGPADRSPPVTGRADGDDDDTAVSDRGMTDVYGPDTTSTIITTTTVERDAAATSTRSRPATSEEPAVSTRPTVTVKTRSTTTSYRSTIRDYPRPVVVTTEQDSAAYTTLFDENMSTDFDYNFTSFAVPVTDRIPSAKSCANVMCLNGGRCEKSKTGPKVSH